MDIGFLGLGNMGFPMARNLAEAGYTVYGHDPYVEVPEDVISVDDEVSVAEDDRDVVVLMLPDGKTVKEVASWVLPFMNRDTVLLDCSTIDVETARAVAADARERGIHFLDAPVSGGVTGADAGTLTFMVGGSRVGYERVKPLFEVMGQRAVHCGDSGSGQAAKICNNMIFGATMIATCEAFVLADRLGLDRQKLFDVVSTSSGYSWSMNVYCPAPGIGPVSPSDNDYRPGFSSELMLKDLRLSQSAAESVGADTQVGRLATDIFAKFVEEEDGRGKDCSAMLPRLERRTREQPKSSDHDEQDGTADE